MKPLAKKLFVVLLLAPFLLGAEQVCTFSGQAGDIIHETGVKPGSPVVIVLPAGEPIEKLLYDRDELSIDSTGREIVISPKKETVDTCLCIVTRGNGVYRFRLKGVTAGEASTLVDNKIIIKK